MRVAVYSRVSTDRQQNGLEAQTRALNEYCATKKFDAVTHFSDFNVSGAKSSRPELDQMMRLVSEGKIDRIVVYSFSRFARSTKHLLDSLEFFEKMNVEFISLSENINTSSAMGKAIFVIISAISQLEREILSERVKNGLKNARAKGKQLGRVKKRNGELIRELRGQGMSYRKIAKLTSSSIGSVYNELKETKIKREQSF